MFPGQLSKYEQAHTLCFSGPRPERLPGNGDLDAPEMQPLINALRQELIAAVDRGKTVMIHGCMAGWDLICAMQVLEIKKQFPGVRLVSVAPYKADFFAREKCWMPEWIKLAREVFRQHDMGHKGCRALPLRHLLCEERYPCGLFL